MSVSIKDEVQGAVFGDQRLTKRLGKIVEELNAKPNMSVPVNNSRKTWRPAGSLVGGVKT